MSHYQHLSIEERESIWENRIKGKNIREIVKHLGRSPLTVSRELKRNQSPQGYLPSAAQEQYQVRRRRSRRRRILRSGPLRDTVVRLLTGELSSQVQRFVKENFQWGFPAQVFARTAVKLIHELNDQFRRKRNFICVLRNILP